MFSIFIYKGYSISKTSCSPATFYVSMPNITDGVNITCGHLLLSAVRGQTCLLLFQQTPGACSVLIVPEEFPLITRETPGWEGCTEKSMVKIREESPTQTPLERESKLSNRSPNNLGYAMTLQSSGVSHLKRGLTTSQCAMWWMKQCQVATKGI